MRLYHAQDDLNLCIWCMLEDTFVAWTDRQTDRQNIYSLNVYGSYILALDVYFRLLFSVYTEIENVDGDL